MKILVINSNKTICEMSSTLFTKSGYDSICAIDGKNGLSLIQQTKFDVVFLCLKMPDFSGYDIIDYLERNDKLKNNRIIIFTSVPLSTSDIDEFLRRGVYSYLKQPTKPDVILKTLQSIVES